MGLILRCDDNAKPPRRVDLVLSCDGHHGLFQGEVPIRIFTEGGYVANRHAATVAGWLITGMGRVLCPSCAKRPTESDPIPKTKADMPRLPV
jgi:hypothetical protein